MDQKTYTEIIRSLLSEASPALGKPETMAQRHNRLLHTGSAWSQEKTLRYAQEILKDWKSGDMGLARLDSALGGVRWLADKSGAFAPGMDPRQLQVLQALQAAFLKKHRQVSKAAAITVYKSIPNITPNQFTAFLEAVVDFCKNDWKGIEKNYAGQ
jgi:hypothetical protein